MAMQGGTVFHFITDGIEAAMAKANEVAGGQGRALGRWRSDD
jgi:hypothetical protein